MKTVTQYREDLKDYNKKLAEINTKATNESRDLREDELAVKVDIMDEIDRIAKIVENLEREERLNHYLDKPASAPATRPRPEGDSDISNPVDRRTKDCFKSFGEQMIAVVRAGTPGGTVDPRLRIQAATGLGETVSSDGGLI